MFARAVRKFLPESTHRILLDFCDTRLGRYATKSYSQEGEDMILRRLLEKNKNGFYVDVGAHHPQRFSNTYYFYKKGWRGINLDAMPGSMKHFEKIRKKDINLEIPVSKSGNTQTYFMFNEPALNGFSMRLSESRDGNRNYRIIDKKEIKTYTLEDILDTYLPDSQEIDFLSVDVEGLDLDVLESNNWEKYRPRFVVVEILHDSLEEVISSEIYRFLSEAGYMAYSKTVNTVIFKRVRQL
jgi:FkbM family methyltransferase